MTNLRSSFQINTKLKKEKSLFDEAKLKTPAWFKNNINAHASLKFTLFIHLIFISYFTSLYLKALYSTQIFMKLLTSCWKSLLKKYFILIYYTISNKLEFMFLILLIHNFLPLSSLFLFRTFAKVAVFSQKNEWIAWLANSGKLRKYIAWAFQNHAKSTDELHIPAIRSRLTCDKIVLVRRSSDENGK